MSNEINIFLLFVNFFLIYSCGWRAAPKKQFTIIFGKYINTLRRIFFVKGVLNNQGH